MFNSKPLDGYQFCKKHQSPKISVHYDKYGKEMCCIAAWGEAFCDPEYQRIGLDVSEEHSVRVSTVWLGSDHQFGDGPPLIFETMVFGRNDFEDRDMQRYSTLEEAKAGHQRFVDKYINNPKKDA